MDFKKAVITAAGPAQRSIPLQMLIDHDGTQRSVLAILIRLIVQAGIDEICVVAHPGDEQRFKEAASSEPCHLNVIPQPTPGGYAHALFCANEFSAGEPILHLVGDHMYVGGENGRGARELVTLAESEGCSVSAVQPTRESMLHAFGAVGARRVTGRPGTYKIDSVIEKPTPTEAEQKLVTPGLRAGHYLCFYGMHAFTPLLMELLGLELSYAAEPRNVTLSGTLAVLARHQQYLAFENHHRRYDLGSHYGLMMAQMALALRSSRRDEVTYEVLELFSDHTLCGRNNQRS